MLRYADASALVRTYLDDEEADDLKDLLFSGREPTITSEIVDLEVTGAVMAAARARRIRSAEPILGRFREDVASDGPLSLLDLDPEATLPAARQLMLEHPLRTLDAIHLAVALEEAETQELVFVTRNRTQAAAARRLGLAVL